MKKVIAAWMTVLFLGSAGLVLAQTPAPADTPVVPAATPVAKKKHKKKKKAAMEATPSADAAATPASK